MRFQGANDTSVATFYKEYKTITFDVTDHNNKFLDGIEFLVSTLNNRRASTRLNSPIPSIEKNNNERIIIKKIQHLPTNFLHIYTLH